MLSIESIEKGVVIDHIHAGRAMQIYYHLSLETLDCSLAILKNVRSAKRGKKDMIKIEDRIDLDLNVLGYVDSNITVNIIENGVITSKLKLSLPNTLTDVIKCKNPRCITAIEQQLPHVFKLSDCEQKIYRCSYCEQEHK